MSQVLEQLNRHIIMTDAIEVGKFIFKRLKGMSLVEIFKMCHATIDKSQAVETHFDNVYAIKGSLFPYAYMDGLLFMELNPFIFNPDEGLTDEALEQIQKQSQRFKQMELENKWEDIFSIIDKKIGLISYIEVFDKIPNKYKWDAFIAVYTRSEYGFEILREHYQKIFESARFSFKRKNRLNQLKEKEYTIYHGENFDHPPYDWYSWTLKKETALWFATRHNAKGEVWETVAKTSDMYDYLTGRNEEEILYIDDSFYPGITTSGAMNIKGLKAA